MRIAKTQIGEFLIPEWDGTMIQIADGIFWDEHLRPYMDKWITPENTCIDIGAHGGFLSVYMSKKAKKVYSFEAQKYIFWMLCSNLFINKCYNVQAVNVAVYDTYTKLRIADSHRQTVSIDLLNENLLDYEKNPSSACISFQEDPLAKNYISTVVVDDVIPKHENVSLIKCDVQGADLRALKGCQKIIERCKPVVLFEYEGMLSCTHNSLLEDYQKFFDSMNYKILRIRQSHTDFVAYPKQLAESLPFNELRLVMDREKGTDYEKEVWDWGMK